jgi:hypothetical protein
MSAACNLSRGRQEVCKESIGGLAGVYFLNFTTGSFTKNGDGEVTALPSGSTVYYYELKGNNNTYTETVNSSRDNGTTFFSQELSITLKKLTNEMTTQLKLMAYSRPKIIVWTKNGEALLVGEVQGADLTTGTINVGGALGDLYGYTAGFTGEEKLPAAFLSGSTQSNPFAGLSAQPTIVYS